MPWKLPVSGDPSDFGGASVISASEEGVCVRSVLHEDDLKMDQNGYSGGIAEMKADGETGFQRFFIPPNSIAVYEFTYYRQFNVVTVRMKQNF